MVSLQTKSRVKHVFNWCFFQAEHMFKIRVQLFLCLTGVENTRLTRVQHVSNTYSTQVYFNTCV